MTTPFCCVVDASVAVKLYLAEPLATEAVTLFGLLSDPANVFYVPDLFYVECANIFWKYVRRQLAAQTQASYYLTSLKALPLQRTSPFDLAEDTLTLALAHDITAYDACYVALAQRLGMPFLTADQKLVQKLSSINLPATWLGAWKPPTPSP
jgi:predicted nucleic acid-binding protein